MLDSRNNNERDNITGALICRHDIYLQLLEGPQEVVKKCFERISIDDRHVSVTLLANEGTMTRLFPNWSMKHDPFTPWIWAKLGMEENSSLFTKEKVLAVFQYLSDN